jgi:DNA primase catalytic core
MSRFRTFIEEVRSRTDIAEIIGADVELRESGSTLKGLSPFHEETRPSFIVWPRTQTWHDFSNGGGRGGDVFSYIQEREGCSFTEAVYAVAARVGVRAPDDSSDLAQELGRWEERREVERILSLAAAYYHHVLPSKIRENWYRKRYGFRDETIDDLLLGWANGHLYDYLTTCENISREAALKTGLFVQLGDGRIEDFFQSRLVFPYWRGGRVVYFIARSTEYTGDEEWEKAKYKKLLTHSERHNYVSPTVRNDFFYNEDAARGADELLITEGVTDCISAMQACVPCISPVTTRFRKQDVPRLLELTRRTKRVIICNDSEASGAGEAGARETAAALWAEGREVCLASIPRPEGTEKIDVNELVASQGPDALREVLAQAKPYPDYLLESIPQDAPKGDLDRLLEPVLESLTSCSSIRADTVLDAVTAKFGVRRRALTRRMKELASKKKFEAVAAQSSSASLPEIGVGGRQLRDIVTDARAAVLQANERRIALATTAHFENDAAPLFQRGSSLVRLERPAKGPPMLSDLTENGMYGVLLREADWIQETEEGKHAVYPPKDVSRDLLTYPPPGMPAVDLVLTTPVFGQDGRLLVSPGLHENDRLWLEADPALNIGEVPENPTPEQIAAASALFFDDLFVDFPFATQSDRAHALVAVLQPFMRRMIEGYTPLYVVEAPAVGSGKGLLCNLVSIVVTGESCDSRTLPESDEEIRKMLTAELSKARPIVLLDNANEKQMLTAASLTSVLTTLSWTDRILGRTEMLTVPNTAMWMLTGNNPRLSTDLARRSVRVRIDPKRDRAWTRASFKHDPIIPWAKAHRSELVHAALVLVRAWLAAGKPLSRARLGSFEHWAAVMGAVLEIAGVEGFLGNADALFANADVEGEAWREFTLAWWEEHGLMATHVADLTALCEKHDLMLQTRGDGSARSQQSRLGRALQSARDRVFGDLQVVVVNQDRKKRMLYALKQVADPDAPAPPAVSELEDVTRHAVDPWQ